MLDQCTIEERWSGVDTMISRWLKDRQTVIVQYCALSGVHNLSPKSDSLQKRLEAFCQVLVDYVSAGHFEIYYELMKQAESFNDGTIDIIKKIVPQIHVTTDVSLDFNDICGSGIDKQTQKKLPKLLSSLGETLASRFELEDKLIADIHNAHGDRTA